MAIQFPRRPSCWWLDLLGQKQRGLVFTIYLLIAAIWWLAGAAAVFFSVAWGTTTALDACHSNGVASGVS